MDALYRLWESRTKRRNI